MRKFLVSGAARGDDGMGRDDDGEVVVAGVGGIDGEFAVGGVGRIDGEVVVGDNSRIDGEVEVGSKE